MTEHATGIGDSARVLLVSPPWRRPEAACPALGVLAPMLREAGIPTHTLHGTLLMEPVDVDPELLSSYAAHFFTPTLYPGFSRDEALDGLLNQYLANASLHGLVFPDPPPPGAPAMTCADLGLDEAKQRGRFEPVFDAAERCVERCVSHIVEGGYEVIGFSATFEGQVLAALAVARVLKRFAPHVRVTLGGAACFGSLAEALVGAFEELDAVCYTEGEAVVVPLIRALLEGDPRLEQALSELPGVVYREGRGPEGSGTIVRRPPPPLTRDLDALPMPDFDDYVRQLGASAYADRPPRLYFETSRGCWWGEKQHCTFCGLNAEGMAFRGKSPERAYDEIRDLYTRYPTAQRLECVDNIIDVGYLDTLLPRLAELPRHPDNPLRLFYEVKSNLRREQLEMMAAAGVTYLQPGIESFSDGVLELMRKGATALTQLQLIKWCYELGIDLTYNILLRTPGERAVWYREMAALIPRISHLPPPDTIGPLWLERFSPHETHPDAFGIRGLRPRPYYAALYPPEHVELPESSDLADLAYVFDYDHDDLHDADLHEAHRSLAASVHAWQSGWQPGLAYHVRREDGVVLYDHRGGESHELPLTGVEGELYRSLDRARSRRSLQRELGDGLDETLDTWARMGIVYEHPGSGQLLALYPRWREGW